MLVFCLSLVIGCGEKDEDTSIDLVETAEEVDEEDTAQAEDTAESEDTAE
jgi:hypothetical protein